MIQFLTFNDVHISPVNPASRKGDYKADILSKLEQIKLVGQKLKVDFFIFAGDLFNLKSPFRNTHELNGTLIELFKSFPAPIYSIEGNHDLRNDSYETYEEQPIRVVYASGVLRQIRDVRLNIRGIRVQLCGSPFVEKLDVSSLQSFRPSDADVGICVLHTYANPDGGMLYRHKLTSYKELSTLGYDIYVLGHYHIDQGIKTIDSNKPQHFINLGAISRGVLVEDSLTRTPKIGRVLIERDKDGKVKIQTQAISLKVKPPEEVFDLEKKEEERIQMKETEQFVDELKANSEQKNAVQTDLNQEIVALKLDIEIVEKVKEMLEEADLYLKEISS